MFKNSRFFGVVLQQIIEKWREKARQAFACRAQRSNTFSFPEALSIIVTDALDTPAADKLLALMTAHRVWSRSPKIAAIPA